MVLDKPQCREAINPLQGCHIPMAPALSDDFHQCISTSAVLAGGESRN
jgi:hypothetical protein